MIRNYTTQIAVDKNILEIEQLLIKFNAGGIYKEYEGQHHYVYAYPIIEEHIGYLCKRCHGIWHQNNKPKILFCDIEIPTVLCRVCSKKFLKLPPNKIYCSNRCRNLALGGMKHGKNIESKNRA